MIEWLTNSWLSYVFMIFMIVAVLILKLKSFVELFETKKNSPEGLSMDLIKTEWLEALNHLSQTAQAQANQPQLNESQDWPANPQLFPTFLDKARLYRQQHSRTLDEPTTQLINEMIALITELEDTNPEELQPRDWESISLSAQRLVQNINSK